MPQRSFSLFALLYHRLRDHVRVDDDGGVAWVPLGVAAARARAFLTSRGFDSEEVVAWLRSADSGALGPAALAPDGLGPPGAEPCRLVDADVFAEAVRDYVTAADDRAHEALAVAICDGPVADGPGSLPRALTALLARRPGPRDPGPGPGPGRAWEPTPDDALAGADPEAKGPGQAAGSERELEALIARARAAAPARESPAGAGVVARLRWGAQHFWRTRGRRVRATLEDLRAKERRLRACAERFRAACRRGGPRDVAEAWVLARSMVAQVRGPLPGSGGRLRAIVGGRGSSAAARAAGQGTAARIEAEPCETQREDGHRSGCKRVVHG